MAIAFVIRPVRIRDTWSHVQQVLSYVVSISPDISLPPDPRAKAGHAYNNPIGVATA